MGSWLLFWSLVLSFVRSCALCNAAFFVDGSRGSDANDGHQDTPFWSVARARDAVRALNKTGPGRIVVYLRGGDYFSANREPVLRLTAADSGTPSCEIVYAAYKSETVRLLGGARVPSAAWQWDGGGVYKADLKRLGLTEFGTMGHGVDDCAGSKAELFHGATRPVLARYPNVRADGTWQWLKVAKSGAHGFGYDDARVGTWAGQRDVWVHGYWAYDWSDNYLPVTDVNASSRTLSVDPAVPFAMGQGANAGARWYGVNIRSELDSPGEYYIDRQSGWLYFFPLEDIHSAEGMVSMAPLVVHVSNVAHVSFTGLQIRYSRKVGMLLEHVRHVTVSKCDVSFHGVAGIRLLNASDSLLSDAVVQQVGCEGVMVNGGDYVTLTPGSNVVHNCTVQHVGQWKRTYSPALSWTGVGNTFTGNRFLDSPHTLVAGGGNDNVFANNAVVRACYETCDAGAWYAGRSWAKRGNRLVNNTFQEVLWNPEAVRGSKFVTAVYFDDQLSGNYVEGNSFVNCRYGVFIAGGRSHAVRHNAFVNVTMAVHVDDEGVANEGKHRDCQPGGSLIGELQDLHYRRPPYSLHYPTLPHIMDDAPCVPVHNLIQSNVYCRGSSLVDFTPQQMAAWHVQMSNNTAVPCTPTASGAADK